MHFGKINMKATGAIFLALVALQCVNQVHAVALSGALSVAGTVFSVVKLGMRILEFVDTSKTGETLVDISELINEVNGRIDASKTEIIKTVVLQSKLDRVGDAVINIQSSLVDLKDVIQASTGEERDTYTDLFLKRFEEHDLIKHIRFLPELLEFIIPGTTGRLVDLLADNTRCNMTAINEFKRFYCELLSDGFALELLHVRMTTEPAVNKTLESWQDRVNEVAIIFENQENNCMSKFSKYAKEDVQAANNALVLWNNSKYRYTWKTTDVVFLKKYGTFQFLFYKYTGEYFFYDESDKNKKIAIFTDKHETNQSSSIVVGANEVCRYAIQGEDDQDAAKDVATCVEKYIKSLGYTMMTIVVFFEGGDISPENVLIDDDSPVLRLKFEDVKLRYCYESGVKCKGDAFNWSKSTKTVVGRMNVLIYVEAFTEGGHSYQTGSGTRNDLFSAFFYLLSLLGRVLFTKTMS